MNYEQARTLKSVSARSTDHERKIGKILERLDKMQADINALAERINDADTQPPMIFDRVAELESKVGQLLPEMTPAKPESRRVRLPRR